MKTLALTILLPGFVFFSHRAVSQDRDSVAALKDFIKVCNVYKKSPLHLSLNYTCSSNFIIDESDSMKTNAEFFITPERSFIKFGHMEQFVDDSTALLVDNQNKRMIVYPSATSIINHMRRMMTLHNIDSNITKTFAKYKATSERKGDTMITLLESRYVLPGTALARETITCLYNPGDMQPFFITTVHRSLLPLSMDELAGFNSADIIKIEDQYFLIKMNISEYEYAAIRHDSNIVPMVINDRVMKDVNGSFTPVPGFASYTINQK